MSFGFKLIVPCALSLYLAAACAPDLDSLSATYSANSTGGTAGTDENPEGGTGNNTNGGGPAVDLCSDGKKNNKESDVDCGGPNGCDRCEVRASCTANSDCDSTYCKGGQCTTPTCKDKVQNGNETGVDCGGSCMQCNLGAACQTKEDCDSGYCAEDTKTCVDHCISGMTDGDEAAPDCGGSCPTACDDKAHCFGADDCKSKLCVNAACAVPSCTDKTTNGTESDTDCGGSCVDSSKACAVNAKCNTEADCASWICNGKCQSDTVSVAAADMIDDFEDADFVLPSLGTPARVGNWYAYGDMSTGSSVSEEVATIKRGASNKGLHGTGKNFSGWGSGIGVDLNSKGTKGTWDASAYIGVTFWARVSAPTNGLNVTVALPDIDTDRLTTGHTCDDTASPSGCDHHYFKTISVTTSWQRFVVLFSELMPEPGYKPDPVPAFKPGALSSFQFRINSGINYELYVDDVGFVKP